MNELQVQSKNFDMLAGMMGPIMPPHLPQMEFHQGLLGGIKHNLKLGQMAKASQREAEIAEYRNRTLVANTSNVEIMLTFSAKMQNALKKLEHDNRMMELAEIEKQATVKVLMLEGQLKEHQVEEAKYAQLTAKLEYELRLKAMENGL